MNKVFIVLCFIFSLCSIQGLQATQIFSNNILFFSPYDVIKAYEGKWLGEQELLLKGRLLGSIKIDSQNKFTSSGSLSSIGTARMADEIIDINATFIILGDSIYLITKGDDAKDVVYEGHISINSVEWVRTEKFYAYDYTKDTFSKDGNTVTMQSYSVKPHKAKNTTMYLEYKGSQTKDLTPFQKLKINPMKLDISKLRI